MAFKAATGVVPYRHISRWRRYWSLVATVFPIMLWVAIWFARAETDPANLSHQRTRDNLTTLLVVIGLLVLVMIWRSFAQRLVVTRDGLIIGKIYATYRVPWASIQTIKATHGERIGGGRGKRFVETLVVADTRRGRKIYHATALTTDSKEALRQSPVVAALREAAPEHVRVYPTMEEPEG